MHLKDIHTLPETKTNPLRTATSRVRKFRRFHPSSLDQIVDAIKDLPMENLETINPFALRPWEKRMWIIDEKLEAEVSGTNIAIRIAVAAQRGTE